MVLPRAYADQYRSLIYTGIDTIIGKVRVHCISGRSTSGNRCYQLECLGWCNFRETVVEGSQLRVIMGATNWNVGLRGWVFWCRGASLQLECLGLSGWVLEKERETVV